MSLTSDERATINAAQAIRRRENRERRQRIKADRAPEKASRGREKDKGFLAYIRRQPCEAAHIGGCSGPIEAAHVRFSDHARGITNPGLQRRPSDKYANPLCAHHHRSVQHQMNERRFWASLGKDAYERAAAHFASYRRGQ